MKQKIYLSLIVLLIEYCICFGKQDNVNHRMRDRDDTKID